MGKGDRVIRLLYAVLAVSLMGSFAAFGRPGAPSQDSRSHRKLSNPEPAVPGIRKLADLAAKNLSTIDGTTLALTPTEGGLERQIVVPDGRVKKTLFVHLTDRFGTVSEDTGDGWSVAGVFRITDTGIAATYSDGRSEVLTLNGSGGVSMVMNSLSGAVNCLAWYPGGHRFSVAERKTALAEYGTRLGIDASPHDMPDLSAKHGCTSSAMGKTADAQPRPSASSVVYSPPPAFADSRAGASDVLGRILVRALSFYAPKQAVNLPSADPAINRRLNPANNSDDGFEKFYANFLAAHEGGYTDNDGNGSPANFGVNQGANPDIDVLNLTQSEAKQLLHDRYWVASGADRLPAALAAVHGDTAINMGVGAANELLAQSGGDPQKYLDLRDARYRSIAAAESDKAKYLPLWLGRNDDLRDFAGDRGVVDPDRSYGARSAAADAPEEQYCDLSNSYYPAAACTSNWQAVPQSRPSRSR